MKVRGSNLITCFKNEDYWGLSWFFSGKESACQFRRCKRLGFEPWVGEIPWRSGIPHQYSCLENPMDRGAWCATVHGVTELDVIELTHNRIRLGIILLSLQIIWKTSLIIFKANALWFIYDPTNNIKFSRICKKTSHTEILN